MSTIIQKWGNSLGVRIPRQLAAQTQLRAGAEVDLTAEEGRLVIQAVVVPSLDELLARIKPGSRPELTDWGRPVGKEVW